MVRSSRKTRLVACAGGNRWNHCCTSHSCADAREFGTANESLCGRRIRYCVRMLLIPLPYSPDKTFPKQMHESRIRPLAPEREFRFKNAGQTPAFQVRHWGNICFREFPLAAPLPAPLPGTEPVASVLGPGITSTKLIWIPQPLTPEGDFRSRGGNEGRLCIWRNYIQRCL